MSGFKVVVAVLNCSHRNSNSLSSLLGLFGCCATENVYLIG